MRRGRCLLNKNVHIKLEQRRHQGHGGVDPLPYADRDLLASVVIGAQAWYCQQLKVVGCSITAARGGGPGISWYIYGEWFVVSDEQLVVSHG